MASIVKSFGIEGVDGYLVEVEIKSISGTPMLSIVGLGDTAVKEAKERLEAVLSHKDFQFTKQKIVINLAPSNMKKRCSHYDLAMAIGLMIEAGKINPREIKKYGFIGELSLNGHLRPCSGVLPMIMAAKKNNIIDIIVPVDNIKEASLVNGVNITTYGRSKCYYI